MQLFLRHFWTNIYNCCIPCSIAVSTIFGGAVIYHLNCIVLCVLEADHENNGILVYADQFSNMVQLVDSLESISHLSATLVYLPTHSSDYMDCPVKEVKRMDKCGLQIALRLKTSLAVCVRHKMMCTAHRDLGECDLG